MALITEHAEQDSLGGGRYCQTIHLRRIGRWVDGNLVRILNCVGPTGDPALPVGVNELFDFRLRGRLSGQAPVLHVGKGQQQIRLTPLDTNNSNGEIFGENGYRYPNAWPNADLAYQIGGHIIRESIPLRTGHPSRFQFRLDSFQDFDPLTLSGPEFRILQPSLDGPQGQHIPLVWAVSHIGGHYVLTVELPSGDYAGWLMDPTLTLQPDAADGKDLDLLEFWPTTNYGTTTPIYVQTGGVTSLRYHILCQFDISPIPNTATVDSSNLTVQGNGEHAGGTWSIDLHRITQAWTEAGATWNTYDGANNWAAAGGDYEATVHASQSFTADADFAQSITALTQGWVAGTWANLGFLLKRDVEDELLKYQGFHSSDNATAANRPKLVVDYTLPSVAKSFFAAPIAGWCH